ncbi:glucose-1-phosphate adenylyltransferase [Clostridia bacterium]|nr:glucose-1-phosphate adenylyltransferase [Clostridia bacterium]
MMKNECVAMILAGGQGKRLGGLTRYDAKPAVPFGGKYKIIDFSLSNCAHSGLNTVGVLTQYQPLNLNSYVSNSAAWGFNSNEGGVHVLPPYAGADKKEWYKGTANAIYQNTEFVDKHGAKYIVILSGDHIYKMDYNAMIEYHKQHGGAATIAVLSVPIEDANRFGIMNTNSNSQIVEFEEKPENPKSNLASMGVYVFTWDCLKRHLMIDDNNPRSNNDFGKNIIPQMLSSGEKLFAHEFAGYWKDVGTIESLWQSNMDLLRDNPELVVDGDDWKIYSHNPHRPPHFIGENANVRRSYITDGCKINGSVSNSIIFEDVVIESGAMVTNSVIMPGAVIGKNAQIERSIIGNNANISTNCRIGIPCAESSAYESVLCTNNITLVSPRVTICKGTIIGQNCMVDNDITTYTIDINLQESEQESVGVC